MKCEIGYLILRADGVVLRGSKIQKSQNVTSFKSLFRKNKTRSNLIVMRERILICYCQIHFNSTRRKLFLFLLHIFQIIVVTKLEI